MRPMVLLASLVVLGAAFAGCVGQTADDDPTKASDGSTPAAGVDGSVAPPAGGLVVRAPLTSTITAAGEAWVAPGSTLGVSVAAPAKAAGKVNYTWAIGPLPGTTTVTPAGLNLDKLAAGASGKLTFEKAGVYEMHCHPHPWMMSNVTVVDGYAGPKETTVYIVDGATNDEYRFIPEAVVIPAGGSVVYKNLGEQMHTATQSGQSPPLTALGLKDASGEIVVSGEGWQRVVVLMEDTEGRFGAAEHHVYVAPLPENYNEPLTGEFRAGYGSSLPQNANEERKHSFKLDHPGTIFLNFTAKDVLAQNNAPEGQNLAKLEVHLKVSGSKQDTLTSTDTAEGALSAPVEAGTYELTIVPTQGASIKYDFSILVIYDLTPPPPTEGGSGGGHAHGSGGGHAGH